jgi:hypothetical protein
MNQGRELQPWETIADLLSHDLPGVELADTEGAAKLIVQRLIDAGFVVIAADDPRLHRMEGEQ